MKTSDASEPACLTNKLSPAGYARSMPSKTTPPIKTIDLFAGAGGLTAGFREASRRFKPVVAVEFDRDAAATFAANHRSAEIIHGSIEDWVQVGDFPEADVIIGGPPCQGFSALGKQNVDDRRNFLWEKYADVMLAVRPKYFVIENVAQFLTSPQFGEFERQTRPGGRLDDYDVSARGVLNAAQYGAAQTRKRTVIIGRRRDMPIVELPRPSHTDSESWRTVKDALNGLDPWVRRVDLPDSWSDFNGQWVRGHFTANQLHVTRNYRQISLDRIRSIKPGGNRFQIPPHLQPDCWLRHQSGSGDVMGRLSWDKPSVTIRTEFVKPEKGRYLHPDEDRAITLQEGARLQGFPDKYLWCGSKTAIAKQIGNAVPIPLGTAIGRLLADAF